MAKGRAVLALSTLLFAATAQAQTEQSCTQSPDPLGALVDAFPSQGATSTCGGAPFVRRDAPLAAPVEGLSELPGIPLPSRGPDADGYFHPDPGYVEGGTFATPLDRAEWRVDPSKVAPRAAPGFVRMVEWNVARGAKLDGAVKQLKKINADVIVLNETDLYGGSSGGKVVAREIAAALGYSYVTAVEFNERRDDRRGSSGNAVLSRWPLTDPRFFSIPMFTENGGYDWAHSRTEPRCGQRSAIATRIDVPDALGGTRTLNVVSLHTENKTTPRVRRRQFDAVREALTRPGEPTVMAGDLNTFLATERLAFRDHLRRNAGLVDCANGDLTPTFSAGPVPVPIRLDWVIVQAGSENSLACLPGSYRVLDHGGASDHMPVRVELRVRN